ncbi:ESX-1 secretion-associated protein EspC [Mycobacterium ahvazicum]|uniref:ESX-1 secretion-associated protein EspC n=1 Tax=Mycobacterium ahvazicum TaxID=1964395 RepID=A0A2K4YE60_9MYCO|nr:type VII secretion target [Mycobacterium ahvazicum]SOX55067.1 ESX-1 secretion-associated protein EspC [Mycobacterium ahvazicum]
MTDNLQVEPAALEAAAVEQDESAVAIGNAMATANGLAQKLIWDHGLISAAFWGVMFVTEREREAACTNMISVCEDLAQKLRDSATAYGSTDTQTGANLKRQVLPG